LHTVHCFFNRDNQLLFNRFAEQRYVAVSEDQRSRLPHLNYLATIHHGIPVDRFPFHPDPDTPLYLAFLGRIREEKRPHVAIAAARNAGLPLRMAGRIKPADRPYFAEQIEPHVDGINVEFLGELDFSAKTALLGGALATLALTVESLACGTPVIATRAGAIEEIVINGQTGIVVRKDEDLADAIAAVGRLNRRACRRVAAQCFSLTRMTRAYEALYHAVIATESCRPDSANPISDTDEIGSVIDVIE
jgi:glycosyltransferase involved in cell wall biosynthesis